MSHNGPTQAHPCGPMASQRSHTGNFFIPPGAGGRELDIHRLHYGPAITYTAYVCVCVCVPWFFPPGSARMNGVICEAHCDARTTVWMQRMLPKVNISLAEGSMRRLFPYSLVLSPSQTIIWLQLAKKKKWHTYQQWMDKWQMKCLLTISLHYKMLILANFVSPQQKCQTLAEKITPTYI